MANEGWLILEEGMVAREGDVDVVEICGYGFPRWRGGLLYYANTCKEDMRMAMQENVEQSPDSWVISNNLDPSC